MPAGQATGTGSRSLLGRRAEVESATYNDLILSIRSVGLPRELASLRSLDVLARDFPEVNPHCSLFIRRLECVDQCNE
jgi:hypothetical protein